MRKTPVRAIELYDQLIPQDAVVQAWVSPGPYPDWHAKCQQEVRDAMPLLARALDRMAALGMSREP